MSDQSCGSLEQQWTAVLNDDEETSVVHANYTAYIGDQDSTPSTQHMYHLVASMAVNAMSKFNEHAGLSTQKANVVRYMDRYIQETTLDLNTVRRDVLSSFSLSFNTLILIEVNFIYSMSTFIRYKNSINITYTNFVNYFKHPP